MSILVTSFGPENATSCNTVCVYKIEDSLGMTHNAVNFKKTSFPQLICLSLNTSLGYSAICPFLLAFTTRCVRLFKLKSTQVSMSDPTLPIGRDGLWSSRRAASHCT